jgi:hypothetical protein
VFQQVQSSTLPIDDPTVKVIPSPQAAPGSSSDSQPIQNQSSDGKAEDPTITMPVQSNVQDHMFPVHNQQKYPVIRDQDGRLAGWDLPRDHFETNISNFFEPLPEEVPEVKYRQSYQVTLGVLHGLCT